jgi:hypothetical protein
VSALAFLAGVVLLFLLAIVRALVVDEAKGRLSDASAALVERAVRRLPETHQEEKREEWLAELAVQRGKPLSALRWSWNLYRSRRSTAHELRADGESPPLWAPQAPAPEPIAAEPLHPRLQAAVDLAKRFGWQDILVAMQDPALSEIEEPLGAATERFCRTITECRSGSDQVLSRYGPYFDRSTGRGYGPLAERERAPILRAALHTGLLIKPAAPAPGRRGPLLGGLLLAVLGGIATALAYNPEPALMVLILAGGLALAVRTVTRPGPRRLGRVGPALVICAGFYGEIPLARLGSEGLRTIPLLALEVLALRFL